MLLLASYDIVFQEVPGEVTLALNLSACPNNCPGCHSPHLREQVGEVLDEELLAGLLSRYGSATTCVGFMGGDGDPAEVNRLAALVHAWIETADADADTDTDADTDKDADAAAAPVKIPARLKTAWYSGSEEISPAIRFENFDFVKLGHYDPLCGGLDSPDTTNQRFYRIEMSECGESATGHKMVDMTGLFRKKSLTSQK